MLRGSLLAARETVQELPVVQARCQRLEEENEALRAIQQSQVCAVQHRSVDGLVLGGVVCVSVGARSSCMPPC
jgi:hypothetical protein